MSTSDNTTIIAMVGLPRSGKSTIVKQLQQELNAPVVRKDDIRLALHAQRFEPNAEAFVQAIADVMIRSLILSGHRTLIVDETHYSRQARERLQGPGRQVLFYEVPTAPWVCKERAMLTGQPDLVKVIDEMWARHEPLGADELRYDGELQLARAA